MNQRTNQDGKPVIQTRPAILASSNIYFFFLPDFFFAFFLAMVLTSVRGFGFGGMIH
jgi:hypothetical protein